jgi:hypothetical protein
MEDSRWWAMRPTQLPVQLKHVRFLQWLPLLSLSFWVEGRALCWGDERRSLHGLWDVVGCFEDEEGLAALAELHAVLLLDAIYGELDLLVGRSEQGEFAEANVERGTGVGAIFLFDDNDVDSTAESRWVDGVPGG